MRIIVTGASGFLGSHLCRALHDGGRDVLGVARRPMAGFPARMIDDYRQAPGGDVLVHLAESNDRRAAHASGEAHVASAVATLEALLNRGFDRVLYASSAVVYGDGARTPRQVGDPAPPDDAYARGKLACEALVTAADGISARLANLYGPGMSADNVVSTILRQVPGAAPLKVRDGRPVRDFLWVGDAVDGLIALVDRAAPGVYNLATGRGIAIRDLARMALAAAGEAQRPVEETLPSGRTSCLVLDVIATEVATGWRTRVTAEEGMERLVNQRLVDVRGRGR